MINALLVDDDAEIRTALEAYLQRFGIAVTSAASGAAMRQALRSNRFDVVVLDLMLPDENGLSLCQWAQQTYQVPVIMLTAHGDPTSRIVGLEMGADDYIGKPFEPRELTARIHAVLRRAGKATAKTPAQQVRFADWTFDRLSRHLVSADGVVVPLSSAEYRLLVAFIDHPRRVLSRDQLIELTRAAGVDVNDRSIDLAVSRLRQKLNDEARSARLIVTVRGEGYLFDALAQ
jgi:two-component system, OmpR family, response regulator